MSISPCDLLAEEGGVAPAREVADLRLPVFGEEHPLMDQGKKMSCGVAPASVTKSATPFLLGESLPPIPVRLVANIQKGEFADLLRDNIEADRRHTKDGSASGSAGQLVQSRWDVTSRHL